MGYIGSGPTRFNTADELTVTGDAEFNGNATFGDNDKIVFGAGSDLEIYHSGSTSVINENGTGNLALNTNGANIQLTKGFAENLATFNADGAVTLFYDNAPKLDTTATGVDVTGTVTADGLTIDATSNNVIITGPAQTGIASSVVELKTGGTVGDRAGYAVTNSNNGLLIGMTGEVVGTGAYPSNTGKGYLWNSDSGLTYQSLGFEKNLLQFYIASSEKMRIDSSGNVGIGTSSPVRNLDIARAGTATASIRSTGTAAAVLYIQNSDTGFGDSDGIYLGRSAAVNYLWTYENEPWVFGTNNSERMRIDSSGNVGIGTSSPNSTGDKTLHINGTTYPTIHLTNSTSGTLSTDGVDIGINGTSMDLFIRNREAANILFSTSATERMRIDSSGNVLVGKTSSSFNVEGQQLNADGTTYLTKDSSHPLYLNRTTSDGDLAVFYKDGSPVGSIGTVNGFLGIGKDDTGLVFINDDNTIRPFDSSSNTDVDDSITLGQSSKRFKDLYLSGTAYVDTAVEIHAGLPLKLQNVAGNGFATIQNAGAGTNTDLSFSTAGSERMRIDTNGNLLVGTSSASSPFDGCRIAIDANSSDGIRVRSSGVPMRFIATGTSTFVGSISTTASATSYNTSSDYRLKENVTATWDATTRLKQLNPVRFNFIADPDTTVDGFLAHEVQTVVPEAISGTHNEVDDEGNPVYQGIDQSKLVPLLVKTIQELEARIAALETA